MYVHVDRDTWAANEGKRPFAFKHGLAGDPRLSHQAIVELSDRIPVSHVEMNTSDLPTLFPTDDVPELDRRPSEIVEKVFELRRWVGLHNLEVDPQMKQLMDECLDPIEEMLGDFQGGMTDREGYLFIAPPGSTTPVHLDYEHNFLLHIQGTKRVTVGFVDPELEARTLESMTGGAYGRLPELPKGTQEFILQPGDGIYISPSLAHTIDTIGDDLSVSLSLVFQTPWLQRGAKVNAANHDLRRLGLKPAPYGASDRNDNLKAAAVTVWRAAKSKITS